MKHEDIVSKLTLAEKCGLLSGKDMWSTRSAPELGIPSIILSDGPSGVRRQLGAGDQLGLNESEKATCFPSASTVANSWDEVIAQRVGEALGREASALGVDVLLGPGLNVKRSPLCGRNFEYFSEDPYLAGKMAAGYIRGIQSEQVSACPKHFAVNSQELHRMASDSVLDERTLREIYLANFEIAVREGLPKTIMTSYNAVNGTYANENAHLLTDILRGEWGFDGTVVTDWGGGNDFTEGVRAGCNLEMPGTADDSTCQLYQAVKSGGISEREVDQRVDELLNMVLWVSGRKKAIVDFDAQNEIAREAAEASIVLLKNEDNVLPLSKTANVAIMGDFASVPRYQGAGSSQVNAVKLSNTIDAANSIFKGKISFSRGFTRKDNLNEELANEAAAKAKSADVVLLYLGLPEVFESEGLERPHMRIPDNQIKLLEKIAGVNPNIVVVFSSGSAVEMPWLTHCMALVWSGLGGQAGALAALKVIAGEVNPSGKLAETFPMRYEDLPICGCYPADRVCEYREGLFIGYRYTETVGADVLFPFGYGLSYTTFSYANIQADNHNASFDITNTGKVAGSEIAQVYCANKQSKVLRPAKALVGFAKVHLNPGETKRVTVEFCERAFQYYNVNTSRYESEGGEWTLEVCANIRDVRLSATVHVDGTGAAIPASASASSMPKNLMNVTDREFERMLGRSVPMRTSDRERSLLQINDPIDALVHARNPLARLIIKFILRKREKSIRDGKPNLNLFFTTNMPFRAIAKMMNGMVSMDMAQSLLTVANSRRGRGFGKLIVGYFTRPSIKKVQEAERSSGKPMENIRA